jgi:hypothetical protein
MRSLATARTGAPKPPEPNRHPLVRLNRGHPSVPTCHTAGHRARRGQGRAFRPAALAARSVLDGAGHGGTLTGGRRRKARRSRNENDSCSDCLCEKIQERINEPYDLHPPSCRSNHVLSTTRTPRQPAPQAQRWWPPRCGWPRLPGFSVSSRRCAWPPGVAGSPASRFGRRCCRQIAALPWWPRSRQAPCRSWDEQVRAPTLAPRLTGPQSRRDGPFEADPVCAGICATRG